MTKRPCPDGPLPDGTDDLTAAELETACGGLNPPPWMTNKNKIIVDDGAPIRE